MSRRILYPGAVQPPMTILITGAVHSMYLIEATTSLKKGVLSKGHSCNTCSPGTLPINAGIDQMGDPTIFDSSKDVTLLNMGEYLGYRNFRQGGLPKMDINLCVFFSDLANPDVAWGIKTEHQQSRIQEVETLVSESLGIKTVLEPTRLLRPSWSSKKLQDSANRVLYYLERNLPVPDALLNTRKDWFDCNGSDSIPALERALW